MSRSEIREFVGGIASLANLFGPPSPPAPKSFPDVALQEDLLTIIVDARLVSVELAEVVRSQAPERMPA